MKKFIIFRVSFGAIVAMNCFLMIWCNFYLTIIQENHFVGKFTCPSSILYLSIHALTCVLDSLQIMIIFSYFITFYHFNIFGHMCCAAHFINSGEVALTDRRIKERRLKMVWCRMHCHWEVSLIICSVTNY